MFAVGRKRGLYFVGPLPGYFSNQVICKWAPVIRIVVSVERDSEVIAISIHFRFRVDTLVQRHKKTLNAARVNLERTDITGRSRTRVKDAQSLVSPDGSHDLTEERPFSFGRRRSDGKALLGADRVTSSVLLTTVAGIGEAWRYILKRAGAGEQRCESSDHYRNDVPRSRAIVSTLCFVRGRFSRHFLALRPAMGHISIFTSTPRVKEVASRMGRIFFDWTPAFAGMTILAANPQRGTRATRNSLYRSISA